MSPALFLKNKISRFIKTSGTSFIFTHMVEDNYHQKVEGEKISIVGVYHEKSSFITLTTSDSGQVQRKKSPMILTLIDESVLKISQGDKVEMNGVTYTVSGVLDIQNFGVAADISLEMGV